MNTSMKKYTTQALSVLSLLTLPATAAWAEGSGSGGGGFVDLIPLLFIFVIFWFFLIRPQQKRLKAHHGMIQALAKGDKVITGGGFFGTIIDVKDDFIKVEIADGVRVKVRQDTILDLQKND
ncbi:MAG: preprotein translocase subunit YajC [Mariprofundaceae bacterium]|nr:preprotein translocase subunit YajC [Mariprofundaceae bacterium]